MSNHISTIETNKEQKRIIKRLSCKSRRCVAGTLAIALPCVIAHSYFSRRIERFAARMEGLMGRLLVTVAGK